MDRLALTLSALVILSAACTREDALPDEVHNEENNEVVSVDVQEQVLRVQTFSLDYNSPYASSERKLISAADIMLSTSQEPYDAKYKICVSPLSGKNRFQTIMNEGEVTVSADTKSIINLQPILNGYMHQEMQTGGLCVRLYLSPQDVSISPQLVTVNDEGIKLDFLWEKSISVIPGETEPIYEYSPDILLAGLPDKVKANDAYDVVMAYQS